MKDLEYTADRVKQVNEFLNKQLTELKITLDEIDINSFSNREKFKFFTYSLMRKKYSESRDFVNDIIKYQYPNVGPEMIYINSSKISVYTELHRKVDERYDDFFSLYINNLKRYPSDVYKRDELKKRNNSYDKIV